ncbi:c-type cytochrome [Lacimonas salitolerans]|uniref:C-type cytochrome n=1 Tax=Lacimonas salitolerans TaxID=1323750 RepID=A0ABW4ED27_9RHOB
MKTMTIAGLTAACLLATPSFAQDFSAELKARQGQFRIMALNLGIIGSMAQGQREYDAEAAQSAADTLVAVSMIQQGPHWPEGSDDMSIDGTRAQPSIWEDMDDFSSKWADFGEAAQAMQASVANGQEALGPLMGEIGGTCKACHDNHRAPES